MPPLRWRGEEGQLPPAPQFGIAGAQGANTSVRLAQGGWDLGLLLEAHGDNGDSSTVPSRLLKPGVDHSEGLIKAQQSSLTSALRAQGWG